MLRYPILLVHGMGFRDSRLVGYWGRIPETLQRAGCRVFFGNQDSNGSIETNARQISARIGEILAETGAARVNIIAHSKGGLDSRYAITALGMAEPVASLTTISTPHHGSETVDCLMRLPKPLVRTAGFCADVWCRVLGDRHPDSYRVFQSFTTAAAAEFNANTPDCGSVFYQSYAFVMQNPFSDFLLWLPNLVVGVIEGENDGLLPPSAVKWGNFRGVYRGNGRRGISHLDEIDLRRRPLSRKCGSGVSDITDLYLQIVRDLQEYGL